MRADGCGLIVKEVYRKLLPNEGKVAVHLTVKSVLLLVFYYKTEHCSFKTGYVIQVVKLLKEDCYGKNFGLKRLLLKVLLLKYQQLAKHL